MSLQSFISCCDSHWKGLHQHMYNFLLFHLKGIATLSETVTESNYYKDQKLYSSINCVVDLVAQLYSNVTRNSIYCIVGLHVGPVSRTSCNKSYGNKVHKG